jgi:hypothetical protein
MTEYGLFLAFATTLAVVVCVHLAACVVHDMRNE